MQTELARSMERLRLKGYEAPFFASYRLTEERHLELSGRHGAIFGDRERRDGDLFVDVRVGSYLLDSSLPDENTVVIGGPDEGPTWFAPKEAPLDGDPIALRNALWLATDEKYKEALAGYLKKRSKAIYRDEDPDRAPSFSHEIPVEKVGPILPFPWTEPFGAPPSGR